MEKAHEQQQKKSSFSFTKIPALFVFQPMKDFDVGASMPGFPTAIISERKGNTWPPIPLLEFSQNTWAPFGSFNYASDCIHWRWGTMLSHFVFIIIYPYSINPLETIHLCSKAVTTASLSNPIQHVNNS